jgi:transcription elongation factor Elf1
MKKPKPCPFCGETSIIITTVSEDDREIPYIFCNTCPAQMIDVTLTTKETSIRA